MDALYVFRHSVYGDVEIRYSLRSVAKHAPYIRRVWIFGDRLGFTSDDPSLIEQIPHSYISRSGSFNTPVTSFFLLLYVRAPSTRRQRHAPSTCATGNSLARNSLALPHSFALFPPLPPDLPILASRD